MKAQPRLLAVLLCGGAALLVLAGSSARAEAAAAAATGSSTSNSGFEVTGPPQGFGDLAKPREILVDIYFGGKKVGSAIAVSRPGFLQFRSPQTVAALLPNLADPAAVTDSLSGDLATHSDLVCMDSNRSECGKLATGTPGIIFDEGRFRADVFVPPALLRTVPAIERGYLDVPRGPASLTSIFGLNLSGSQGQSPTYNLQDRTTLALGPARVRTDMSYSSGLGLLVDDFAAEVDRRDLRYSAGLFWAPGLDLTGRRRIAGVGVGTQFDTRADRENLTGTPVILFLSQPARVDFVIDGRLAGSRAYDAGNNILDTSGLPEGSYPLVLRIHGADGTDREERRFFVKTTQITPVGQPAYFAYAGFLANSRPNRLISISDLFYYQAGSARRLSRAIAVDLSVTGTQHKAIVEAGAWLITPVAQVRAAALVSVAGDTALLLQGTSSGRGPVNFAVDLRRVSSHDGRPLIPLPALNDSLADAAPVGAQLGGTYTQASATLGYRIGRAYFSVLGSLRKDSGHRSDYSIGPSVTWPVISLAGFQLTFQADGQRSRTATSAFAGVRLFYNARRISVDANAGYASTDSRDGNGPSRSRAIGGLSASYSYEDDNRTQISAGVGVDRNLDSTAAHAGGTLYSRFGNIRADVLDTIEGAGGLQYGVSMQSAIAATASGIGLGARDLEDSAVIVDVGGESGAASFQVLVNNMPYGHVSAGSQLPLHLQPYRAYDVRIRPDGAAPVSFDSDSQKLTLYPGTVKVLRWTARSYLTMFGQAVLADGTPLADAMVEAPHSVGETDDNGYFQIDAASGDYLTFTRGSDRCQVVLNPVNARKDFVSLGKVVCK